MISRYINFLFYSILKWPKANHVVFGVDSVSDPDPGILGPDTDITQSDVRYNTAAVSPGGGAVLSEGLRSLIASSCRVLMCFSWTSYFDQYFLID